MNESSLSRTSHVPSERVMSQVNESCPMWTSHVLLKRVKSQLNGSCLTWTSHVPNERVMSQVNESCPIGSSPVLHERVKSQMNWSRFTGWRRLIGCLIFIFISRIRALEIVALWRQETRNFRNPMHFRRSVHEQVEFHVDVSCPNWMSHVLHKQVKSQMNESCLTWTSRIPCGWVMSDMNESNVPNTWVMSYIIQSCPTHADNTTRRRLSQ